MRCSANFPLRRFFEASQRHDDSSFWHQLIPIPRSSPPTAFRRAPPEVALPDRLHLIASCRGRFRQRRHRELIAQPLESTPDLRMGLARPLKKSLPSLCAVARKRSLLLLTIVVVDLRRFDLFDVDDLGASSPHSALLLLRRVLPELHYPQRGTAVGEISTRHPVCRMVEPAAAA